MVSPFPKLMYTSWLPHTLSPVLQRPYYERDLHVGPSLPCHMTNTELAAFQSCCPCYSVAPEYGLMIHVGQVQ